jgi:hypothetical protein
VSIINPILFESSGEENQEYDLQGTMQTKNKDKISIVYLNNRYPVIYEFLIDKYQRRVILVTSIKGTITK